MRAPTRRLPVGHQPLIVLQRMHRPHWLARRLTGITATDVGAIFGLSAYKTPMAVWAEKTGRAQPDDLDDDYAVQRGNALEGLLLRTWCRDNHAELSVKAPALLAHPQHPWLMASLDGLAVLDGAHVVVEAKSAGWRTREDWWDDTTGLPDMYAVQVLTQLAVTGLDTAYVVADVAGEPVTRRIERDRWWEDQAIAYLRHWWARHVGADAAPDPDPVRDWPLFTRTWTPEPKSSREADAVERLTLQAWRHAKADHAASEGDVKRLRGQVRIAMGTTQTLTVDGVKAVSIDARGALRAGPALIPNPIREETPA